MLCRFVQRTAWRPCINTLLVMFLFLLHLRGSDADDLTGALDLRNYNSSNVASSTRGVELLAISGCERPLRPGRSLQTYRCFSGGKSKESVELFLRGRGFPTDALLRIQLREHTPVPLRSDEKSRTDLITMECLNVKASDVFPNQILSCILPHPTVSLEEKTQWLKRLSDYVVWMDLELAVDNSVSNSKGANLVTIGVLPHAVQLDLTLGSRGSVGGHLNSEGGEISGDEVMFDDPMVLFLQNSHRKSHNGEEWLSLGIGGLKNQLELLYRRVFLSRISSLRHVVGSVQLSHVRGVLLHGPPGNGKTLIARAIAKLLGERTRVTVVNAADILSKYVGDSEKNLRNLVLMDDDDSDDDDAAGDRDNGGYSNDIRDDVDQNKDTSNGNAYESSDVETEGKEGRLHTIIIDEIESLFRRRGDANDGSSVKAVYEGLTNQLLTLMDGVDRAKNILIIGLTNQLHSIDRALLRPGRFEVVIEIPFPDLEGRTEMFFIHTHNLREEHHLAPDVDINLLAARSGGFSGADIAGTVRAAVSYALMRYRDTLEEDTSAGNSSKDEGTHLHSEGSPKQFQVTNDDFDHAIQDILDSTQQIAQGKQYSGTHEDDSTTRLVDFDGSITPSINATRRVLHSIQHSQTEHAVVVIIYGAPGTGKTFLSRQLVRLLPFDVVKFILSGRLYGKMRDESGMDEIVSALRESVYFKGNYALVIENVERILSENGPMAWEVLKSTIREFKESTYTRSLPYEGAAKKPHGKRLLVVTTSEKETLHSLMHSVEYDVQLTLHLIQRKDLLELLKGYGILPSDADMSNEVVHSYPPKLSYRQFLRITDRALWRAHDVKLEINVDSVNDNVAGNRQTTSLYSSLNAFFLKGGRLQKRANEGGVSSLNTKEHQREFSNAVQDVVSSMGLSNMFDDLLSVNDAAEGDEVLW